MTHPDLEHATVAYSIRKDPHGLHLAHAECSCGWQGPLKYPQDAWADAAEHEKAEHG